MLCDQLLPERRPPSTPPGAFPATARLTGCCSAVCHRPDGKTECALGRTCCPVDGAAPAGEHRLRDADKHRLWDADEHQVWDAGGRGARAHARAVALVARELRGSGAAFDGSAVRVLRVLQRAPDQRGPDLAFLVHAATGLPLTVQVSLVMASAAQTELAVREARAVAARAAPNLAPSLARLVLRWGHPLLRSALVNQLLRHVPPPRGLARAAGVRLVVAEGRPHVRRLTDVLQTATADAIRALAFQLVHALRALQAQGLQPGGLRPSSVLVDTDPAEAGCTYWAQGRAFEVAFAGPGKVLVMGWDADPAVGDGRRAVALTLLQFGRAAAGQGGLELARFVAALVHDVSEAKTPQPLHKALAHAYFRPLVTSTQAAHRDRDRAPFPDQAHVQGVGRQG